ncbi:MAG: hypothetical protein SNH79_03415 [Rikenellaceae bacterium]
MLAFIRNNLYLFLFLFLCLCAPQFVFGAFKFIGLFAIAILFLGVVALLAFRWRIASIVSDMEEQQNGGKGASGAKRGAGAKNETIGTNRSKSVSKDVGDYVDFEDVEERK